MPSLQSIPKQLGRIYAFGLTYLEHIKETGEKVADPVIFEKHCAPEVNPEVVAMPRHQQVRASLVELDGMVADAVVRGLSKRTNGEIPVLLDYEVELAMVLLEAVSTEQLKDENWMPQYGLCLANDVSCRSVQFAGQMVEDRLRYWAQAKSFASFLPIGGEMSACNAADAFPDWSLELKVNGEVRQSAALSEMILTPRQFVERALAYADADQLEVGDVILTGTPSGVAASISKLKRTIGAMLPASLAVKLAIKGAMKSPLYLRSGDLIESQVKGSDLPPLNFKIS